MTKAATTVVMFNWAGAQCSSNAKTNLTSLGRIDSDVIKSTHVTSMTATALTTRDSVLLLSYGLIPARAAFDALAFC